MGCDNREEKVIVTTSVHEQKDFLTYFSIFHKLLTHILLLRVDVFNKIPCRYIGNIKL